MWLGQQPHHDDSSLRRSFGQLARLPFAQRKECRLGESEKETGRGKNQNHHPGNDGRTHHGSSVEGRVSGVEFRVALASRPPFRLGWPTPKISWPSLDPCLLP